MDIILPIQTDQTSQTGQMQDLKKEISELRARKLAIEAEVAERGARLEGAGVGMKGSLVDREGYPLADIDIPAIRADRHALLVLQNDHTDVMRSIEKLLHELYAQAPRPTPSSTSRPPVAAPDSRPVASLPAAAGPTTYRPLVPFAVIDQLSQDSPASAAGIQLGDQLVRFGAVTAASPDALQAVAATLQVRWALLRCCQRCCECPIISSTCPCSVHASQRSTTNQ